MSANRAAACAPGCRHPECQGLSPLPVRAARQAGVVAWARATFGAAAMTRKERAARLLEEALELAQAEHVSLDDMSRLAAHVYAKPVGAPAQELGGVGVMLLAYAATAGLDADAAETAEWVRVRGLPAEYFRQRQDIKAAAGVGVPVETGLRLAFDAAALGACVPQGAGAEGGLFSSLVTRYPLALSLVPPTDPTQLATAMFVATASWASWTSGPIARYHAPSAVAAALEALGAAVRGTFPRRHGWKAP